MSRMGLILGGPGDTGRRGRGRREETETNMEAGEGADEVTEVMAATEMEGEVIKVEG